MYIIYNIIMIIPLLDIGNHSGRHFTNLIWQILDQSLANHHSHGKLGARSTPLAGASSVGFKQAGPGREAPPVRRDGNVVISPFAVSRCPEEIRGRTADPNLWHEFVKKITICKLFIYNNILL